MQIDDIAKYGWRDAAIGWCRARRATTLGVGLATILAIIGCHDSGTAPRATASLRVVAGGSATDTILAMAPTPLTVEVRDSTGRLLRGTNVVFTALPLDAPPGGNGRRGVYVCPTAMARCAVVARDGSSYTVWTKATPVTDSVGQARANVQFGVVAGQDSVEVSVPSLGLDLVVPYTTRAGAPFQLIAAVPDTAVYVGRRYALGASLADAYGNPDSGAVHIASMTPGVATVANDTVNAATLGRASLLITAASLPGSTFAFVSVPPEGRLVAFGWAPDRSALTQLTLVNTDATGRRVIGSTPGNDGTARPLWTPGGDVAFEEALHGGPATLQLVDTLGARRGRLDSTFTFDIAAAFSTAPATLFFYGQPAQGGAAGIYEANADGSDPSFLVSGGEPAPSPDGSRLAFVQGFLATDSLFVRDNLDGTRRAIASDVAAARWSPAGDWIAFIPHEQDSVTFVRPDGTDRHSIGYRFLDPSELSWSPDGVWVVVAGDAGGLVIIRAADGEMIPIPGTGDLLQASWHP
jgi:WD40-like Beta Propeller Repeat